EQDRGKPQWREAPGTSDRPWRAGGVWCSAIAIFCMVPVRCGDLFDVRPICSGLVVSRPWIPRNLMVRAAEVQVRAAAGIAIANAWEGVGELPCIPLPLGRLVGEPIRLRTLTRCTRRAMCGSAGCPARYFSRGGG